jgi:hypothetical protein
MTGKPKRVGNKLEIKAYMHCGLCLQEMPEGVSAQQFQRIEVGWTEYGLQVWCRRHDVNICHIDFEGQTHPADTSRKAKRK